MLKRVERGALGGEHRTRVAGQAHQDRAGRHSLPVIGQHLDRDLGIQRPKKGFRDFEAGDDNRLARHQFGGKAGICGDGRR